MSTVNSTAPRKTSFGESAGVGWLLLAAAFAMPWLLPIHFDPWTTFYPEAFAFAVVAVVAVWALLARSGQPWQLDFSAIGVAALVAIPLLQAAAGLFVFRGESWLISLYLCALASTLVLARHAQQIAPHRLVDALFGGLLIAALASTAMTICQWLGLNHLGVFVLPLLEGGRAAANLAQPNNLATLLSWGIVAVWWAYARGRVGPIFAIATVCFVLVGIALTRSRTGWLLAGLLAVAAATLDWRSARPHKRVVVALVAWFVLLVVGLEPASQYLWREAPATLSGQTSIGRRPLIWQLALLAIADRPWFGYGWNQSVQAHVELIDAIPSIHTTVQHAHNVVLDLLLWNGVPIGLLLIAALTLWSWRRWRVAKSSEQRLVLLALALFAVHAMLELPHAYAFFLLPVAVMAGTLNAMPSTGAELSVPRWLVALVFLVQFSLLGLIVDEYRRIERISASARMDAAGIYNPHPESVPRPVFLRFLQDALDNLRIRASAGMARSDIERMRHTLKRYPTIVGLSRFAQISAMNGRPDDAQKALSALCKLNTPAACQAAIERWKAVAAEHPEWPTIVVPRVD